MEPIRVHVSTDFSILDSSPVSRCLFPPLHLERSRIILTIIFLDNDGFTHWQFLHQYILDHNFSKLAISQTLLPFLFLISFCLLSANYIPWASCHLLLLSPRSISGLCLCNQVINDKIDFQITTQTQCVLVPLV